MNKFLWSCAALLTLFVTVECLICNSCDLEILGICPSKGTVNCSATQNRCYTAVAKFSADLVDIHEQGCTKDTDCSNSSGTILNVHFNITRTCCSTNLCNGATSNHFPLTAALCAALVAVWSQWVI